MPAVFELPAELTIYSALETRDALLAWIAEQSAQSQSLLELSARQVVEIDGAGLQLLAALSNMELSWHLVAYSDRFADTCRMMGLSAWLEHGLAQSDTGS